MTEQTVTETFEELRQEVLVAAAANNDFVRREFLQAFGRELEMTDVIEELVPCDPPNVRGMSIDGYGFNSDEGLDLFIADHSDRNSLETLTKTEVGRLVRQLTNFFSSAFSKGLHRSLEETSEVYAVARAIAERGSELGRIRLFVISERQLSERYDAVNVDQFDGQVPVSLQIWDIGRLHRLRTSRGQKEPIEIDFNNLLGEPLPCLPAYLKDASYRSYLVAMPGTLIADLYARYGTRLLEQNVRAFLQARNKANRGIRTTILEEPEMFFAYNNGITATASTVEIAEDGGRTAITGLKDLQIVNGGQTTASLFHARRKEKADLSDVFVQMKLTVIEDDRVEELVPRISQYANTQNTVNAADFFSNHPFHIRMEEFSRRIWAPSLEGDQLETHWYYERVRGQYDEEQARLDAPTKRRFLKQHPKSQLIRKLLLAKFENVWDGDPVVVNLGGQKNFAAYAARIAEEWKSDPDRFDEAYFRRAIARAILFKSVEKLVSAQPWYAGGYRANIVAYSIALLAHVLERSSLSLDHERIWTDQQISAALSETMAQVSSLVNDTLTGPDRGLANVTEWAKKEACWNSIRALAPRVEAILAEGADWAARAAA